MEYIEVNKAFNESKEGDHFRNIGDKKGKSISRRLSVLMWKISTP